jgi:hypothetical protein
MAGQALVQSQHGSKEIALFFHTPKNRVTIEG